MFLPLKAKLNPETRNELVLEPVKWRLLTAVSGELAVKETLGLAFIEVVTGAIGDRVTTPVGVTVNGKLRVELVFLSLTVMVTKSNPTMAPTTLRLATTLLALVVKVTELTKA
jgi:hypothetical protein